MEFLSALLSVETRSLDNSWTSRQSLFSLSIITGADIMLTTNHMCSYCRFTPVIRRCPLIAVMDACHSWRSAPPRRRITAGGAGVGTCPPPEGAAPEHQSVTPPRRSPPSAQSRECLARDACFAAGKSLRLCPFSSCLG